MKSRYMVRSFVTAAGATTLTLVCGCESTTSPRTDGLLRVDSSWLVPAAQALVDSQSGQFELQASGVRLITQARAELIATAVARYIALPNVAQLYSRVTKERGSPIAFATLQPCNRTVHTLSAFDTLPAQLPGYWRRSRAPYWSITMCQKGDTDPEVSIGVPDAPMDFAIAGDTIVQVSIRLSGGGNDFTVSGVQRNLTRNGFILAPEEAVRTVFNRTSRRASGPPTPFLHTDPTVGLILGLCASWRVPLESPVTVRGVDTHTTQVVSEVYVHRTPLCVSPTIELYVGRPSVDSLYWQRYPRDTTISPSDSPVDSVRIRLRGPIKFEPVVVVK